MQFIYTMKLNHFHIIGIEYISIFAARDVNDWCLLIIVPGVRCCFLLKLEYYSSENLLKFISSKMLISPA